MNERFKELSKQSWEAVDFGQPLPIEQFEQKFAELIVRECAGLFPNVYVEIENEYGHTPVIAADYIKKHFGVAE